MNFGDSPLNFEATISDSCKLGQKVIIHRYTNLWGCTLGDDVSVGSYAEIGHGVIVGPRTRIGAFAFIPPGVVIGPDCFIGPRATFTNDKFPRTGRPWECLKTVVQAGASIGAGAIILPGLTIGERAMVGAGSVVTENVPDDAVVAGNPARRVVRINLTEAERGTSA